MLQGIKNIVAFHFPVGDRMVLIPVVAKSGAGKVIGDVIVIKRRSI